MQRSFDTNLVHAATIEILSISERNFRITLTQIWSNSIQQLLRQCQFHVLCFFLVLVDGDHLGMPNCKNRNELFLYKNGSILVKDS